MTMSNVKAIRVLMNNVGEVLTFTFLKKNGEPRTMTALVPAFFADGAIAASGDDHPYILVHEINGGWRFVNLETLINIEA